MEALQTHWLAFAVALGAGLLIGVERERRKGAGSHRAIAGVRTFSIAALSGALAQSTGESLLVAAGALMVLALAAIGYRRQRSPDPGITTELSLFLVYLVGVAAVEQPLVAGAIAVVATGLLTARTDLHRFSTEILTEGELRDILILAGASLVVLPLVPNQTVDWLGGVNPRRLWMLVVIMLALQAGGHVALRLVGPRLGLSVSGLAMGFVSSTATFAAMGARARSRPEAMRPAVSGALASNVATLIQLAVVVGTVHPRALPEVLPALLGGAAGALIPVFVSLGRTGPAMQDHAAEERALSVMPALFFAVLMSALTALATAIHAHYGEHAAMAAAVIGGIADTHAAAASLAALSAGGLIPAEQLALPLILAFSVNSGSKWVAARVGGGGRFARAVSPGLAMTVAGAAAPVLWKLLSV
ncbi:MAG: hypothetical protein RIS35_8 [Pseudomonadota bacterium]|jgi:uncharacterized membrane protein (DUF4010 family)